MLAVTKGNAAELAPRAAGAATPRMRKAHPGYPSAAGCGFQG
jgi:hypothetical protein